MRPSATTVQSICTGWLLTDRLVVIPAYAINFKQNGTSFACYRQGTVDDEIALEADLLYLPSSYPSTIAIGLMQLQAPLPNVALKLQSQSVEVGEALVLLHFAGGHPELSFSTGNISSLTDGKLQYNIDTELGSGGAPLFNLNWEVIGFHHTAMPHLQYNEGTNLSVLLENLRDTSAWPDIVKYHRLADLSATTLQDQIDLSAYSVELNLPAFLLRAAVSWDFDPMEFTEEEKDILESMVLDPSGIRWILHPDERRYLLKSANSIDSLRQARGNRPAKDPRQGVIDRILQQEPVNLEAVSENDLSLWLQVVRWFEGIIPGLPSPQTVSQTLERRRIRSQFEPIAGTSFRGRVAELDQFQIWFNTPNAGPLVVSGIGGVGKSSLVARFALSLPTDTLLLWLDFDRADLAPDDALSVMTLLNQQASVQLTNFKGPDLTKLLQQTSSSLALIDQTKVSLEIEQVLAELGQELCRSLESSAPPLLVLDGFEVAQHVKQHDEIWHVLELILREVPELKIIVSGRAPVKGLRLSGRDAIPLDLKGIARMDADNWLLDQGITDAAIRARVLDLANGVPLNLKLAVRLAKANGNLKDLPQHLQEGMITGYLYDRILDRVIDPLLKPTAQAALVLRKITPSLLEAVLPDTFPEGLNAIEVFDRLTQELALVDTSAVFAGTLPNQTAEKTLWIRRDVRNATLRLLEKENEKRVREIDHRAADWYAKQKLTDEINAAELVYHRLRSGNIKGAETAWLDACIPLLLNTEEDLWPNDKKEREWLRKWLQRGNVQINKLLLWEKEAVERIERTQSRGLDRALYSILGEEKERSTSSPLLFYDAWLRYTQGNLEGARAVLKNAADVEGPVGRNQVVLAAQLAMLANDRSEVDRLLATVSDDARWADRPQGTLEALAVRAARIRLTVNIDEELKLIELLQKPESKLWLPEVTTRLTKPDVLLPKLQALLEDENSYMFEALPVTNTLFVPQSLTDLTEFREQLSNQRRQVLNPVWIDQMARLGLSSKDTLITGSMIDRSELSVDHFGEEWESAVELIINLAVLALQREKRITDDLFLQEAYKNASPRKSMDSLSLSIGATLAVFNSLNLRIFSPNNLNNPSQLNIIVDTIWSQFIEQFSVFSTKKRVLLAKKIVENSNSSDLIAQWLLELEDYGEGNLSAPYMAKSNAKYDKILILTTQANLQFPLLYTLGPDPLETLCRRLLSLPDTFTF